LGGANVKEDIHRGANKMLDRMNDDKEVGEEMSDDE
jgi:hypothetical protein